ncbi:hypothetical protein GKZ90_0014755 [Flavobacterium sp. MC2016-06]|uniref:hypothetical protein n=1 Tax=Flavobacterium sp. MC2016-06 TaxID=2676308 RepID=UPI0012BAFEF7|nr:hypothetical protein [Flavobacterium sp. MC2016-06]MBU3859280.1 hypothetical protein [Flavobacterium sp. MC2016-06]
MFSKKEVKYVQFSDSVNSTQGQQKKAKHEVDFLLLDISNPIKLKFKKITYNNPNPLFFRDSIFLFNKKYCIDNLFYNKQKLRSEEPLRLNYASGYTFSFNSKKYISLYFWDSSIPTSNLRYCIILFDVSDKENIIPYFFDEQMSFNPACFGDFNNDGILDFANWSNGNRLELMSLAKNKFKPKKNKFVIIEEISNTSFEINWDKSKWIK